MDSEGYSQDLGSQAPTYVGGEDHAHVHDEVLWYAYEQDLIKDYTLNSFSISHLLAPLAQSTLPSITENGFTDDSSLPSLETLEPDLESNLDIPQSAQNFRDEALRELTDGEVKTLTQGLMDSGSTRHLKLELPILGVDDECNMKEFRRELAIRQDVRIGDHRLPLDLVTGEGMQLPESALLEANELLRKLENEKLGITRSALQFLADVVKDEYDEEEQWNALVEEVKGTKWVKNPGLEKLELPISPQFTQDQSIAPDDAYLIPIPSDPSSSIFADDLKAAEEQIFEEYGDVWSEPTSPILDKFLETEISEEDKKEFWKTSSREVSTQSLVDDHKIEPPILSFSPLEELSLPGPEAFESFVAQQMDIEGLAAEFLENFSDDHFEEELANAADLTMKTIEQEQLHAADATARVPVPIMDFSIPEPEWKRLGNNAEAIFKYIKCGHESLFRLPRWPRDSATESQLIWRPIGSEASRVSTEETIDADDALIKSLILPLDSDGVPTSLEFVQKRTRLAILEHMTEDDEIEVYMEKPKHSTTTSLEVTKKRVLDAADGTRSKKPRSSSTHIGDSGRLLVGGSPGASSKLLTNFMELHAPKKRWTVSKYFPTVDHATTALPAPAEPSKKPEELGERGKPAGAEPAPCSKPPIRAQYPSIKAPSAPLTIIISLTAPRHLIRGLEGLIPGLTLMERDYNKHNTSIWSPGSVSRTEVVPPLAFDADITLSPSTGVVTTSMIKVRQKPRPQASKNSVQERIEKIAPRYDRLIILVGGESAPDDTFREMSSSDTAALTSFQGFASGLWCKAVVYYIGGGDDTLSRWVASLVCRYALSDPSLQACLMEDETLWELWLRRAGFNAYAAQIVAGQLKVPKTDTDSTGERHGLAAFVTMTRSERMRRFGPLVGPRVMERVSRVVDEIWNKP